MKRPPGQMTERDDADVAMMICTAGHVDHGKTRLVKLLTGCELDRLKTEQERGLTIELGFAPCVLGDDLRIGIVDVPGHEKFIKNMVAGVSGVEMALLVIAADDGVMPQTVEHVQILELLGARNGIVALTKTDLVSEIEVIIRNDDIREFLAGSFMADAPICPVSSETFEGFTEFYDTLVGRAKELRRGERFGVFRMPVERTFSQSGFGSVISGIPVDGSIAVGDRVEVAPGGATGRVRAMQRFGRDANEGRHGQCLAINSPDLGKTPPERGAVLCKPGYLRASTIFHVLANTAPGLTKPLTHGEAIKFHTGTSVESGKVFLLEDSTLVEGNPSFATVVVSRPIAAAPEDRFLIRRSSPTITVAGGRILVVEEGSKRPRTKHAVAALNRYREFLGDVDPLSREGVARRTAHALACRFQTGASTDELARALLVESHVVAHATKQMVQSNEAIEFADDQFLHREAFAHLLRQAIDRATRAADEGRLTVGLEELRSESDCSPTLWERIASELDADARFTIRGTQLVLNDAQDSLSDDDRDLMERIVALYDKTALAAPRPDDVPSTLDAPAKQVAAFINHLCSEGRLIPIAPGVILSRDVYRSAQSQAVSLALSAGELDFAAFKQQTSAARKYVIPFLEHLDSRGVTIRSGQQRRLATGYEAKLL